jgi:hypothetical protein
MNQFVCQQKTSCGGGENQGGENWRPKMSDDEIMQAHDGEKISAQDISNRINKLNAVTPQSVHDYLALLSSEDERRLLEERDI